MNQLTSVFKLADILYTPQGIALGGAFPSTHQQLKDVLAEVNQCVNGLDSVSYLNNSQQLISLPVKESQYTTSINDRVNLFFLLDLDHLPNDLVPGITIYKKTPKINSDSSVVISASSIE